MKKFKPIDTDNLIATYAERFVSLKRDLNAVGYFCKGTVLKRMMKCGQKRCACQHDPSKRHGLYFEWTFKAKGKTINIHLQPEEAPVYQKAVGEYRKLKSLLTRMERLSRTTIARLARKALSDSEKI
jgi:hypothetical protein